MFPCFAGFLSGDCAPIDGLSQSGAGPLASGHKQETRMIVTEHTAKSARHTTFYLAAGREDALPVIFVHGWPELSISWRHQLPTFANLGFRAIAPDMRGYGRSSTYSRREDYAQEQIVADM